MNKQYLLTAGVVVVVGALAFFGGMQFQKSRTSADGRLLAPGMAQMGIGMARGGGERNGAQAGVTAQRGVTGPRPVSGEVMSQDDTSVTVSLADGSTKILFLSDSTVVNKTSEASRDDVAVGDQVMAIGTENADGSVTVQSVSIGGGQMFQMNMNDGSAGAQPIQQ